MFVHVPQRRRGGARWATALLVVVCVAVFVALGLSAPATRAALVMHWGLVPAHLLHPAHKTGWHRLLDPDLPTLLTALFIHVQWLHLASNLLFLVIFGLSAERALGSWRFLSLFLLGGVFANLMGALTLARVQAPIIGCSGAVSAVVGAYLALFPRARLGLVVPLGLYLEFVRVPASLMIGLWALLQLLFGYLGAGFGAIAWWSHIAGFLFGIVFSFFSRDAVLRRLRP